MKVLAMASFTWRSMTGEVCGQKVSHVIRNVRSEEELLHLQGK